MHQRWMHKTGADGARASSERDEGDAQSMMVDNISVSAASSAKGPTSSVQAVTRQEVVQTMSGASSVVDDHLRLMTAGVAELRQMEVVRLSDTIVGSGCHGPSLPNSSRQFVR